jgi:hypothetical protein
MQENYYKPLKIERKTLRLTEETCNFIKSFGANDSTFAEAFDNMMIAVCDEKRNMLAEEVEKLRSEKTYLERTELEKYIKTIAKLTVVKNYIDNLHREIQK